MPRARHLLLTLLLLAVVLPLGAQDDAGRDAAAPTAWEEFQERHPGAAENDRLGPLLRAVLDALTPEQASAFLAGEDPATIRLAAGGNLDDLLRETLGGGGPELVYVPVAGCRLFATWYQGSPGAPMAAGEIRNVFARGADLSVQGGSATGCGIPAEAVAILAQLRISSPSAKGFFKAWPVGDPMPTTPLVDYDPAGGVPRVNNATIVEICDGACGSGDFKIKTALGSAHVRIDTVGYFKAIVPGSGGGIDADLLDGLDSTDFALVSHTHDGGDITSGTVGEPFIDSLIARDDEVLDILKAGDGAGSGLDADLLDGKELSAFRRRPQNVILVDGAGGGDFTTIGAALASITTESITNRYLVRVADGTYTEQVAMKPFVDIEGKGKHLTVITSATCPTLEGADDAELRNLEVECTGGASSIAIRNFGVSPMLTGLDVNASGGTADNTGILNDGAAAAPMLSHVWVYAGAAATTDIGVRNVNGAAPTIRDSQLWGLTAAIRNEDTATAKIANTQLMGDADVVVPAVQASYMCVRAYVAGTLQPLNAQCFPNTPPTAVDDAYATLGNTLIEVTLDHAGAASADNTTVSQPSVIGETTTPKTYRSVFENDTDAETADKNLLTAAVVGGTVTAGAVLNMFADGTFEYTPPVGFTGADTFDYTVTDPGGLMDTGTVTVNVSSVIWYVDNDNGGTADGRSTTPYTSLAPIHTGGSDDGKDGNGDTIFVFDGTGNTAAPILLEDNQVLQGHEIALDPAGFEYAGGGDLVAAGTAPSLGSAGDVVELASGNTVRGLDIAATNGRAIFGNASAGATISQVGSTGTGTGTGVRFDNATGTFTFTNLDVTSSTGAGIDIQGGSATFTFDSLSSISGVAAEGININGGTATLSFPGDITHSSGAALQVTNHATGTVGLGGTNNITGGTGLQFSNADGTYNVTTMTGSTTLNGGDAGIDILAGSSGTFTFSNISITDPSGRGLNLDTSTGGNVTYNGTISKTNVASPASAVRVNAKTGGSVSFTNSITGNTATANAIDLTSNAGSTITFSGLLDLDTTTGTGFNATGGGTVQATNAGNTVTTVGDGVGFGIGVSIGAGIGALGVTFSSVDVGSSGKAGSGIVLADTGNLGTFSVTGGTIQNTNNRAFDAANVDGTVAIGASLQNDGGRSVEITGSEGNFTFSNLVDEDAQGVNIAINTGTPTFTFSGGLDIDTNSGNTGFTAFSGGTLQICADTDCDGGGTPLVNTIDTTLGTGRAIGIDGVTIGAAGVTFRSIDVDAGNGPAIRLDTTGAGAFTVTGINGPCGNTAMTLDCDGGTLENIQGDAIQLENTDGPVSLSYMLIEDIGSTSGGIDTLSGHDAIHGQSVDGGLTLDNVTIRRISDMAVNGTLFTPVGPLFDPTTVWNGLTITDSHIANTNRFDPALTLVADDSDEGGVRILGLRGTTLLDGNVFERGGTLVQLFVTTGAGPLPATTTITITENDFLEAYKEFSSGGTLSKGITCLDVIAQATGNVDLTVGSRATAVVGHQANDDGNLFLNCHGASLRYGNDSVSPFGLPAATGSVSAEVGNNTFQSTDHDSAQSGDFDFPRGYLLAITRGTDTATLDTRISYNLFDEVSFEGGLGQLNLDFEDGIHQAKVDFNTFDSPGHAPWFVRGDSSASAEVLFRDNIGIRGPFCSGDPSAAGGGCDLGVGNLCPVTPENPGAEGYCGPGESATASVQNLADLDMGIIDDTFALEDAFYTIGETVRIRTVNTGGAGTICAYLEDNTSPNGYGLQEDGGTLELEQGGSASSDPATVLGDNTNTGTPKNIIGGVSVTTGTCVRPTGSIFN